MPTETETRLREAWGAVIKARREALRLSLADVAMACGVSKQRVHQIEQGQGGTPDELRVQLARTLQTSANDLFQYPGVEGKEVPDTT